jgi:hypothetical protein
MLPLARSKIIHLRAARIQCPSVFASNAKQENFSDVPEIEADTTTVRAAVFANLMPDNIALVLKTPRLHHLETFR